MSIMRKKSRGKSQGQVPLRPLDNNPSLTVVSVNNNAAIVNDSSRRIPGPSVWDLVDIEPLLMIHLVASMIGYVGNQNLLVVKTCMIDLALNENKCLSIGKKTILEEQTIQKLLTSLVMWRSIIGNFLPMILVAQIGAWSDKYGRKIPMIMVILTFIMEYVFMMWAAFYRDGISAWKTGIIASGISSLAGNNACFGMALFSYISDVTPIDKLTARTSISGSCYFLGILAGLTIGGHLTEAPLPVVYAIAAILEVIVLIGLALFIKSHSRSSASLGAKVADLFSPKYMVESLRSIFKLRPGNRRKMLLLLLTCHIVTLAPMSGDSSVEFLAVRYRYGWDAASYSSYVMFKTVIGFFANFVSLAVLSEVLQLSDAVIGIISCLSLASASVLAGLAKTPTLAYIAPMAGLLAGSVMAVSRTLIFKLVSENETGKINSFIGSLESLTPLIVVPIYTNLYSVMFETCAGCYNLLSAGIMIVPIAVYVWIRQHMKT